MLCDLHLILRGEDVAWHSVPYVLWGEIQRKDVPSCVRALLHHPRKIALFTIFGKTRSIFLDFKMVVLFYFESSISSLSVRWYHQCTQDSQANHRCSTELVADVVENEILHVSGNRAEKSGDGKPFSTERFLLRTQPKYHLLIKIYSGGLHTMT